MTVAAGKYHASINAAKGILRSVELFSSENIIVDYPSDLPSVMRGLKYRDQWERCNHEGWYHFRLSDGSLLQFRRSDTGVSYTYMETPISALSFEDFAYSRVGEEWEVVENELRYDYELYLTTDLAERSVTPVRYDFEPELYRSGVHPAGHFHFGVSNQIRICASKILNPMSFVLFVIRQFYPGKWEIMLGNNKCAELKNDIRDGLDDVHIDYLCDLDHYEMILG